MEDMFLDRVAGHRTAGIPSTGNNGGVPACLVHEVTEEERELFQCKTGPRDYKLPPPVTNIYKGFYSDVRECVQPDSGQSFLDALRREFQETVYNTYWNKQVGRVADPTPMLPVGTNPLTTCFGRPTPRDVTVKELVSPPKCYVDVMEESRKGHERYRQTHNDYDPGEQTDRHYVAPYRRDLVWGTPTPCDPHGGCMKKVMQDKYNDKLFVSKILADHRDRNRSLIGKVLAPNNNISCVPEGHAFGKLNYRPAQGAGELLKDCSPSMDKVDLYEELSHINTLRQQVAKRQPALYRDIIDACHYVDTDNTGCLPIDRVYQVLAGLRVFPNKTLFESLMKRLNILRENCEVCYEKLANTLNVNAEFPDIAKIDDVPKDIIKFETTNQIAYKYHCDDCDSTRAIPRAGLPPRPHVAIGGVISPNIFTNYGLSPKDFFAPRSPEYLRNLFKCIGCFLDDATFCKIWDLAKDDKGCVSVQSFLIASKKYTSDLNF